MSKNPRLKSNSSTFPNAFDHANENPESCNADRMIEAQNAAELQLVQLEANGTKIRAEKIHRCSTLQGEYKQCHGAYYGDDTPAFLEERLHTDPMPQATEIHLASTWEGAKLECVFTVFFERRTGTRLQQKSGHATASEWRDIGGHLPRWRAHAYAEVCLDNQLIGQSIRNFTRR